MNAKLSSSRVIDLVIPGRILHLRRNEAEDASSLTTALQSSLDLALAPPSPSALGADEHWADIQQLNPPNTHPRRRQTNVCSFSTRTYTPYESHYMEFKEIEISSSMAWEHFPNQYDWALMQLKKELKPSTPLSSARSSGRFCLSHSKSF